MKKRLLSLALCLALCLGLLPVGVLAADGESGGVYVPPSSQTGAGGGVYEDTNDPEVASVIRVNGTTTNYATLPAALNEARDGDTVKLLENHTTNWSNVEAGEEQMAVVKTRITLDLNGNTVDYLVVGEVVPDEEGGILESYDGNLTVKRSLSGGTAMDGQITTLKFVKGTLSVQDGVIIGSSSSSTGLICEADSGTVTISGGMVYNATVGTGAAVTVSGGSMHQGRWTNYGTLNITGGTFGSVEFYNNGGTIAISGGTFNTLRNYDNESEWPIAPMPLLAPGHAFYKDNTVQDGSRRDYLQNVTVKEHTHTMVINKCACGYTCPHTSVNESSVCTVCGKQMAASVTVSDAVTYYDTFSNALVYASKNDGCTLKLLANVESAVSIEVPLIFDLNGHNVQGLSVCAKVTVRDSSTKKGKIGRVLIFDKYEEKANLTLGDLLEEGYGFKHENGIWADDSHKETISGLKVTVEEAPIKSVVLDAIGADTEEVPTTMAYGTTGAVTLEASCWINDMTVPTYTWYKLEGAAATAPMEGVNGVKYKLPADLPAGKHTYLVTCTSGGYSKSAEITITVTPISLECAEVTVQNPTYNGKEQGPEVTVKLGEKTLVKGKDFSVFAEKQTNAGSYKLTISGQNNYTGEIKDVAWKIEPIKIDSFMVSSDIFKTYDGTAAITKTPEEWAKVLTFKTLSAYDIVNVPSDAYTISDASFIENRNGEYFDSPDAGEKYGIFFKITLKSSNYVLQNYYDDEPAKSKEYAQSGAATFTITKAPALDTQTGTLTVANNHKGTYTFDLKALLPTLEAPKSYGSISYETPTISLGNYYTKGAKIEDGVLSIPINAVNSTEEKGIGTITVVVTTENYNDITLTLNVSAANKKVPTGTPTLSKATLTYGYKLSDITLSGSMKDGEAEVTGTFTWKNPNEILTAGKHQAGWVFTPTDSAHYIEVTGESEVTVAKATPSGTPSYTAITESGKTLEDAHLAVGTIQPEGTIQWVDEKGNEIDVFTEVKANTAYTWKFMPDDKENYNSLTGTITLWHKSSSSSSSGAVTPGTKTDTVKNPDGSTTKTETKADGSKTETTTASSGGGSTGTTVTKTDAKGNTTTEASAKLSDRDVKEAQEKGEAVTVPVKGIAAAKDANAATKIKIDVPNNANKTTVEIPVENVTSGTVAVIVHEDGTEELVKDSKPTEHGVQLELSGSTTVKIIDNSKTFDDTKGHWSQDDVNFVAARELFNGVGGNQFGVSQPMTRGMVNTVLARLAGVDTTPGQGQAWYEVGTDWAKKNGISDGTNPTAPVTREQLATLLYRYAGSPSVSGTLHAADAASVSDYAEDALLWANQNGIVNGVGSNTIAPKDNAQRAQVAAMLARYLQNQ